MMFAESIASARLEWVDADGRVQVRVWDGRTGQCMQTLTGHREEIQDLAISRRRAIHSHPAALSLSFGLHFASRFALRDGASSWGGRRSGWARCHSRLRRPCALAPFPVHRPTGRAPCVGLIHRKATWRACPVGRVGLHAVCHVSLCSLHLALLHGRTASLTRCFVIAPSALCRDGSFLVTGGDDNMTLLFRP
jgi:WD40 repeat protein